MPHYGLNVPSQYPVVTLVDNQGNAIDYASSGTAPSADNSLGMIEPAAIGGGAPSVWFTANAACLHRFGLQTAQAARYFRIKIGVAGGNVQYGVVRLTGAGHTTFTRVMNSGIIACPAAGDLKLDMGRTVLGAGDYALFFWADNTTVTVPQNFSSNYVARQLGAELLAIPAGVPASGTLTFNNRTFDGYLEADV